MRSSLLCWFFVPPSCPFIPFCSSVAVMTLRRSGHARTGIPFLPYVCGGGHRHSFGVTSCWFSLPVRFSLRFRGGALWRCLACNFLPCIAFVTAVCMAICATPICMVWRLTYLFFGGRWRCCCLCVLFMHDMQHACAASFFFFVISFACYGVVVLPMRVGLHCLVVYLWYISTVVRFFTWGCPPGRGAGSCSGLPMFPAPTLWCCRGWRWVGGGPCWASGSGCGPGCCPAPARGVRLGVAPSRWGAPRSGSPWGAGSRRLGWLVGGGRVGRRGGRRRRGSLGRLPPGWPPGPGWPAARMRVLVPEVRRHSTTCSPSPRRCCRTAAGLCRA